MYNASLNNKNTHINWNTRFSPAGRECVTGVLHQQRRRHRPLQAQGVREQVLAPGQDSQVSPLFTVATGCPQKERIFQKLNNTTLQLRDDHNEINL